MMGIKICEVIKSQIFGLFTLVFGIGYFSISIAFHAEFGLCSGSHGKTD